MREESDDVVTGVIRLTERIRKKIRVARGEGEGLSEGGRADMDRMNGVGREGAGD